MTNDIYIRDGQGRQMLAGDRHLEALAIAHEKQWDRERWRRVNWGYPENTTRPNESNTVRLELPEIPTSYQELTALWNDIVKLREEQRKIREDMRGLTQAVVNYRKEASLARGDKPSRRSALEG